MIDFTRLLGVEAMWTVAYAVCYIQSETDQKELLLKVGTADQARIWLNGTEVYRNSELRAYVPDLEVERTWSLKQG